MSGLSGLALAVTAAAGVGPRPLVLLTAGSFVTVYALDTAAALRLLPRAVWRAAPRSSCWWRSPHSSS
ncbi:hypothetical protein ACFSL4_19780 [Streptomyces caeni]|uniref:Uncharacterized protein n=1 Tax=Streptomyces caeni TaxID=2307231 RepID=A0ABW4IUX6_9ACTN